MRRDQQIVACGLILLSLTGPVVADVCSDYRAAFAFRDTARHAIDEIIPNSTGGIPHLPSTYGPAADKFVEADSALQTTTRRLRNTIADFRIEKAMNALDSADESLRFTRRVLGAWREAEDFAFENLMPYWVEQTETERALERTRYEIWKLVCRLRE